MQYAKNISITECKGYYVVDIKPFYDSSAISTRYILIDRDTDIPDSLPTESTIIRTPVDNIVIFGSVYCGIIDKLGDINKIVGVGDPEYINIESVKDALAKGKIENTGKNNMPNIEKVAMLSPDVIFCSPFEGQAYDKLKNASKTVVTCTEFTESTPLSRAEWIKFFGILLGKRHIADSIFSYTKEKYNAALKMVANTDHRPKLLVEKRYGGVWYLPAKDSYTANLYRDAGADYGEGLVTANKEQSVPLSFESVFDKYSDADIWIIKYMKNDNTLMTYSELEKEYGAYSMFKAFKDKNIYGCNSAIVPYFETTTISPEIVLYDLIKIMYPDSLKEYNLQMFHKLQ